MATPLEAAAAWTDRDVRSGSEFLRGQMRQWMDQVVQEGQTDELFELELWLRSFERHGLFAYAVFGQRVDATDLAALLELPPAEGARAHPRVIVLHQLVPQAAALQPLFQRWGTPVLATQPYRQGDVAAWEQDANGLALGDTPFYLVQPEAAGSIDPLMVVAHAERGRRTVLIEPELVEATEQIQSGSLNN